VIGELRMEERIAAGLLLAFRLGFSPLTIRHPGWERGVARAGVTMAIAARARPDFAAVRAYPTTQARE
jgi:hypothetical protein